MPIIIFLIGILLVGFAYEQISRIISKNSFQPDGKFVEIDSHKLHYLKKGEGSPTVVFESGLDPGGHLPWYKVQNECAKFTTTISYDRSGILWSERGNSPKNSKSMSDELKKLLVATKCPKPYIIVGHSLAGLFLREFIVENEKDIKGIIFIDVSHPEQDLRKTKELKEISKPLSPWLIRFANTFGILRLFYNKDYPSTNKYDNINQIVHTMFYKGVPTFIEEQNSIGKLLIESSKYNNFDSIPLIIVTGFSPNRYSEIKDEKLRKNFFEYKMGLQKNLLNLSTNSEQILAYQSEHYVQLDEPKIIVDLIKEIVLSNNKKVL